MEQTPAFPRMEKKLGFGCMRLPMKEQEVDAAAFSAMIDAFLGAGFCYFDTAHGYLGGRSETALRACLTARYPRERYLLTDKLSYNCFEREEDIRPFFESQLAACGVGYFDFYLMHAQNADSYRKYTACRAYETAQALRAEGRVRHVGISFHDKADVLERILTEHPELEAVQLQFNYADYDDPGVQGRLCYEVCRRHGKPVFVMEPVKGGKLALLPEAARAPLDALKGGSPASYAIRWAAGFEGVAMVLSGMSSLGQMEDNLGYMRDFRPLGPGEREAVGQVLGLLRTQEQIACTACRYCTDGCPQKILIPDLFACWNEKQSYHDAGTDREYAYYEREGGAAASCVGCGQCEQACPQHLPIRALLKKVAAEFGAGGD